MHFNLELAQSLVGSEKEFPVDFNEAWQWLEYSRKDNAKKSLLSAGFVPGFDYEVYLTDQVNPAQKGSEENVGGRPSENIYVTVDCFKTWAMMSNTPKGKEVRKYFLECERIAKQKQALAIPDRTMEQYVALAEGIARIANPMMRSLLEQRYAEEISATNFMLTGTQEEQGVLTVRALKLGYSQSQIGTGTALGKYIVKQAGFVPEGKITHGKYSVNWYKLTPGLDRAIHQYFTSNGILPRRAALQLVR